VNLNSEEKIIFDLLKSGKTKSVSLDEINIKLKKSSRQSLIVRLKYLTAKIAPHGYIIERTSGIGRGIKAEYQMRKRF
jgi:hypothetical protein